MLNNSTKGTIFNKVKFLVTFIYFSLGQIIGQI